MNVAVTRTSSCPACSCAQLAPYVHSTARSSAGAASVAVGRALCPRSTGRAGYARRGMGTCAVPSEAHTPSGSSLPTSGRTKVSQLESSYAPAPGTGVTPNSISWKPYSSATSSTSVRAGSATESANVTNEAAWHTEVLAVVSDHAGASTPEGSVPGTTAGTAELPGAAVPESRAGFAPGGGRSPVQMDSTAASYCSSAAVAYACDRPTCSCCSSICAATSHPAVLPTSTTLRTGASPRAIGPTRTPGALSEPESRALAPSSVPSAARDRGSPYAPVAYGGVRKRSTSARKRRAHTSTSAAWKVVGVVVVESVPSGCTAGIPTVRVTRSLYRGWRAKKRGCSAPRTVTPGATRTCAMPPGPKLTAHRSAALPATRPVASRSAGNTARNASTKSAKVSDCSPRGPSGATGTGTTESATSTAEAPGGSSNAGSTRACARRSRSATVRGTRSWISSEAVLEFGTAGEWGTSPPPGHPP
ncbi:MAG TPA: hypothetical protein VF006_13375 [Longimicrobium sp.]